MSFKSFFVFNKWTISASILVILIGVILMGYVSINSKKSYISEIGLLITLLGIIYLIVTGILSFSKK